MTNALTLEDFRTLLRLQELDSSIDQFTLRRDHLAGQAVVAEVQQQALAFRPRLQEAQGVRDDLAAKQSALEAEVAAVEKRIAEINARLYDGSLKLAPNDALAMSQEVRHLKERLSKLEDDELEVMEALEPAEATVTALEQEGHALSVRMQAAQTEIGAGQAEIDESLMGIRTQRANVAAEVPESLKSEYDTLRTHLGGVAVAPLLGSACGGCHLTLSATEVAAFHKAPESSLLHCEECGRLLVR